MRPKCSPTLQRNKSISNIAIATGLERYDPRFKQANTHFKGVEDKYLKYGYTAITTGHSLGNQLSKYVNDHHQVEVASNVVFSRGSGIVEQFRKKQHNMQYVSKKSYVISLGVCL